jgi:hypothetical protein
MIVSPPKKSSAPAKKKNDSVSAPAKSKSQKAVRVKTKESKKKVIEEPSGEEIRKPVAPKPKIVKSKEIIDITKYTIFSTQKKRILDFAIQNKIPSKFVFPVFKQTSEIKNVSIKKQHPSDLSDGFETILTFIERETPNSTLVRLVDRIREIQPKISEREALFYISDVFEPDDTFYTEASKISIGYENPEVFQNEKENWTADELPKLLKMDRDDLKKINEYFKDIETELDPVQTSDMKITKVTIEFDIVFPEENVTLIQVAPDLFANMKTSYDIPFVKYTDQSFSKYKVFSGDTFETRPPFKLFENRFSKFEDKNMIYMILLADPGNTIEEYTKSSYIPASINLSKNILSFKYFLLNNRPENEILEAIQKIFPTLQFVNRREKNYGATFNIYKTFIREDSFLDYLISEPFIVGASKLFSSLLFVDEFDKPVSEKKKLKLYYDTNIGFETKDPNEELSRIASLGFYMTQYRSGINDAELTKGRYLITEFEGEEPEEKIIGTKDAIVKSVFFDKDTPYILVSISKAVNKFVLFQFMNVFARLLNLYNSTIRESFEEEYNLLIPELNDPEVSDDLSLILKPKKPIGKERVGKINLSAIAPEIFTKSYSTDCQYKYQPIDIEEEEIETWKNKKIERGKEQIERPIKKLGDFYFVCPTDKLPFVEFKQNLDEPREYDVYPCCYEKPREGVRERKRATSHRTKDPIKTNKITAEGGLGTISTPIEEMLAGAFEKSISFYRMGTLISPSSFLACVCLAIEDKQFSRLKTDEEKEDYLKVLRLEIAKKANFLLTSSELFDIAETDRIENFKKVDEYMEPTLYYRIIEEIFGLNIFVFSGSLPKPNVDPIYALEISRFSSIPIHSYRKNLPTLLVYKHWGAETDHLEYPQCEIIIARLGDKDATLFSSDIARYLLKGYLISAEVYGKVYIPERNIFENYSSNTIYQLLEKDFFGLFQNKIIQSIGQIIDEKGKLSALQIQTKAGKMTIGVPPLPPQNLPLITEIEKPKLEAVRKIFVDEPTGYSYEGDKVVSVWFKILSLEFGIQIPIEPINKEIVRREYRSLYASVPENRFTLEQRPSEIRRLLKLQKDVNIIIQLVRWIFLVLTKDKDWSVEQRIKEAILFIDKVLIEIPRREKDSGLVYDFSKLPRKLPSDRSSLETILKEISLTSPTFTDGKNIFISGKVFYQRIKESLIDYIRLNIPIVIPDYLDRYYESTFDYPKIPKTLVFLSTIDFTRWLEQAKEDPTSSYPVLYSLKGKLNEIKGPYLYAMDISKPTLANAFGQKFVMIIQNAPLDKSKESALENSIRWRRLRVNRPQVSSLPLSQFTNYKVFSISPNETFELIEDKSEPSLKKETIYILNYPGTNQYASVLPLD